MSLPALLLIALLAGCANPFEEAKKADTIEAYEKFLAENPNHAKTGAARARLAELSLEATKKVGTLEAYDAFVQKFPKGKAHEEAMKERKPLLLAWAEQQDTVDGWQKVLDDYGKGDRRTMLSARRRLSAAKDRELIGLGEPTKAQAFVKVDPKADPKAAPDGWQFSAAVTNKGDKPARHMVVAAVFSKDDGTVLTTREWPVVAKRLPQGMPLPTGFDTPMAPGETRTWTFKVANLPEGWTQVKLRLAEVRWEGDVPGPADKEEAEGAPAGDEEKAGAAAPAAPAAADTKKATKP